jgi:hypothetical protein
MTSNSSANDSPSFAQSPVVETQTPSLTNPKCIPDTETSSVPEVNADSVINTETTSTPPIISFIPRPRRQSETMFPAIPETFDIPTKPRGLYSTDPWPVGFPESDWKIIWKRAPYKIDNLLRRSIPFDATKPLAVREDQFRGAPWRLTVQPHGNKTRIPIFKEGMVISYRHGNRADRKYIADHCALHDDTFAYIRFYGFTLTQTVCKEHSDFPPFILAIPVENCNVRGHPDFKNISLATEPIQLDIDIETIEPMPTLPPNLPSYFSIHNDSESEENVGWLKKIAQYFCLLPN